MKLFDSIKLKRPGQSKFDLSHERKLSCNMGDLIPVLVNEVVPGDKFRVNTEVLMRLAPLLAPMMHRVNVTTHYFFVPNRLIWNEWEDFITGGRLGTSAPVWPTMRAPCNEIAASAPNDYWIPGSLADYLGVPTHLPTDAYASSQLISALPFRAYQLIWNDYYRDQNLMPDLDLSLASGTITGAEFIKLTNMRRRAWEKDYFTSALPFAQRGGAVTLPVTADATVIYKDTSNLMTSAGAPQSGRTSGSHLTVPDNILYGQPGNVPNRIENIDDIELDAATANINDLRKAVRLQEWLEKNARGGARYIEQILSHFGVRSSDARLQRPEYLGGGKSPIVISEVLSSFQDDSSMPQGTMAGHGIGVGNQNGFNRTFEEHGFIIGLMSVLPRTAYQQGLPKMFDRSDKFDYYWPEFANLGEQEVKSSEIMVNWKTGTAPSTFGYQSRFAEYKYKNSTVHGDFRSSLAFWHMGRIFNSNPVLDEEFVEANPTDRVFAVQEEETHKLWVQIYHRIDAIRPMPYFGTPTL